MEVKFSEQKIYLISFVIIDIFTKNFSMKIKYRA